MITQGVGMHWRRGRKQDKRLGDFIGDAALTGGAFVTSCPSDTVLGWLADAPHVQVSSRTGSAVEVHPIFKSGRIGQEVVRLEAHSTYGGTRATILVHRTDAGPNDLDLDAVGPVSAVLSSLDGADPTWRRVGGGESQDPRPTIQLS